MTVEAKKELLKYKIINQRWEHNTILYEILRYNYLDNIISKISDVSLSFDIEVSNDEISAEQFINLLEEFINIMKLNFFNINAMSNIVRYIFEQNINQVEEYLSMNYDPKEKIVTEKIYKIIISNFIKNARYVSSISILLNENNVKIKSINNYTLEEATQILDLLSDIVFSQRGRGKYRYLFESIEDNLNSYLEMIRNKPKKKDKENFYKEKYIYGYICDYGHIFKTYNAKRKYIKYFK